MTLPRAAPRPTRASGPWEGVRPRPGAGQSQTFFFEAQPRTKMPSKLDLFLRLSFQAIAAQFDKPRALDAVSVRVCDLEVLVVPGRVDMPISGIAKPWLVRARTSRKHGLSPRP